MNSRLLVGLHLAASVGLSGAGVIAIDAQRQPLTAAPFTAINHKPTSFRYRPDSTGKGLTRYRVDGAISYDASRNRFLLSWNGYTGKREQLIFEPRTNVVPTIASSVTFDSSARRYVYSYEISNAPRAAQNLETIYVEADDPEPRSGPSGWYSRSLSSYLVKQLAMRGGWAWSHVEAPFGVRPSASASGFSIMSVHPPGIVRCVAAGRTSPLVTTEDLPEELHAAIDAVAWRLPAGSCVGPVSESTPGSPAASIRAIVTSLDEAERQGWLGNTKTWSSAMRESLQRLRAHFAAGDAVAARAAMSKILAGLSADRAMLSEGRALIELRLMKIETKEWRR